MYSFKSRILPQNSVWAQPQMVTGPKEAREGIQRSLVRQGSSTKCLNVVPENQSLQDIQKPRLYRSLTDNVNLIRKPDPLFIRKQQQFKRSNTWQENRRRKSSIQKFRDSFIASKTSVFTFGATMRKSIKRQFF